MTKSSEMRQETIEAVLGTEANGAISVEKRLLRIARLGMDDVSAITPDEIKQVCFALVVHYHQLGIS